MQSKDVIDLLNTYFPKERKSSNSLTEKEVNFFFEVVTQKNALKNFDAYVAAGKRLMKERQLSKKGGSKPEPQKEEQPVKAEKAEKGEKTEKKTAPKKETAKEASQEKKDGKKPSKAEKAEKAEKPAEIEARQFYEALEKGTAPCVTPEQAYVVSQILEGIYISAKTGEPYYFNK